MTLNSVFLRLKFISIIITIVKIRVLIILRLTILIIIITKMMMMKSSSKYQSLETWKEEVNLLIVFYAYFVLLPPIDKHLSFNLGVDTRKWPIT